jgi:hypothetical protein
MLRRLLIVALATLTLLGPVSISTAQNDATAYRDLATASDPRVRVAAALVLGKSASPGARAALEKALKDKHPSVRAAAAAALGARGDAASLPALRTALAAETLVHIKSQIETVVQRLSSKSPVKVKFLMALGKVENRSAVKDAAVGNILRDEIRAKVAMVPGVEVLADGANPGEVSRTRKLPAFMMDASLTHLAKGEEGSDISMSAKVECLIRKVPEQSLKASMSGTARALADARTVRGPAQIAQLQRDAVAGAVESALKGATPALESASTSK